MKALGGAHLRQAADHNTGSPALTRVNTEPKTSNIILIGVELGVSCREVKTCRETEPSEETIVTARRNE